MTEHQKHDRGKKINHIPNHLIDETSPYLLQHAYNPVNWYPWSNEALQLSREKDKPILLSIGYAACHWCHVMEHESFEDEETAHLMNEFFINIKIDREERPDIDDIYMKAVQMLTGHGGWPMTVFLTPNLKPFYAGTYFPPDDRHGLPSFKRILVGVEKAWQEQRDEVEESSSSIAEHINLMDQVNKSESNIDEDIIKQGIDRLIAVFDYTWGGFGNPPKFPHSSALSLATRKAKTNAIKASREDECLNMLTTTLDKMAYGGIHDQLGGGFARYATDRQWLIPHFEKMLYDNALLCRNYLEGYLLTKEIYWRNVAENILEFVIRELKTKDNCFYSSLDADSEGVEGKFYVWTYNEIISLLGKEDGPWFASIFDVTEKGNFEHGYNILHLSQSEEALAKANSISKDELWKRIDLLKEKLFAARENRIRPQTDDKILTNWNSLMISAFVAGYKILQNQKYLDIAKSGAKFILENMFVDNRLLHTWGKGKAKLNGYLDDYTYFVQALLDLSSVDFETNWLTKAININDLVINKFFDKDIQDFYYTSNDHEKLISRTKNYYDGSVPSATSTAAFNLLRLARITGNKDYQEKAENILRHYADYLARVPDQFANMLCALDFNLGKPIDIVLVADKKSKNWQEILFAIHKYYLPNSQVILKDANESSETKSIQILQDKTIIEDKPTVYICHNFSCQKPLTDIESIKSELSSLREDISKT